MSHLGAALLNAALAFAAYHAACAIRFSGEIPARNLEALLALLPGIVLLHTLAGATTAHSSSFRRIARSHALAVLSVFALAYVFRVERGALPTTVILIAGALVILGAWASRTVFAPRDPQGSLLIVADPDNMPRLRARTGPTPSEIDWAPATTPFSALTARIREGRYDAIVLGDPPRDPDLLLAVLYAGRAAETTVLGPAEFAPSGRWFDLSPLPDRPLVELRPRGTSPLEAVAQRLVDFTGALLILPFAIAAIGVLGTAIRLESPGPIIYRQRRLGRHAVPFEIWKLRTMPVDIEAASGPVWAGEDDPRATRLGRVLRRTGLDELPQIFHILAGQMSVVGPRPERDHFIEQYPALGGRRLLVRPGLTGLAQIQLPKEAPTDEKIRFDHWYIQHRSLGMDVRICIKTGRKFLERFAIVLRLPENVVRKFLNFRSEFKSSNSD